MISFVVQNFLYTSPFLIKTQRYNSLVKLLSFKINSIFLKIILNFNSYKQYFFISSPHLIYFFNKQYVSNFWKFFKKIYFNKFGMVSNNITKSFMYYNIKNLDNVAGLVKNTDGNIYNINCQISNFNIKYYLPIQVLLFSFHKNMYNTFMFYIFFILTFNYMSITNYFKLSYSFIIFSQNFYLYTFPNLYYFKIRNF